MQSITLQFYKSNGEWYAEDVIYVPDSLQSLQDIKEYVYCNCDRYTDMHIVIHRTTTTGAGDSCILFAEERDLSTRRFCPICGHRLPRSFRSACKWCGWKV